MTSEQREIIRRQIDALKRERLSATDRSRRKWCSADEDAAEGEGEVVIACRATSATDI